MLHSVSTRPLAQRLIISGAIALSLTLTHSPFPAFKPPTAEAQQQRVAGWLMVQRLRGRVTYRSQQTRSARSGDRLDQVGSSLTTASRSGASLVLDNSLGSIQVAENTHLQVQTLAVLSDGARVTVLDVPQGQVRLQVRRFSNPNSRLEIHTPSGVAAVRGTEFGVSATEDGRTTVATLSGAVATSAQNQTVLLNPGFASVIRPGEPPSEPLPIDRALTFDVVGYGRAGQQLSIIGDVNPTNTVWIEDEPVSVSRQGRVRATLRLRKRRNFVDVEIRNPLGERRHRRVWIHHDD
ncbi:MAG: FecR family protein [Cyanobacteria bacterium J06626_23]